MLHNRLGYSMHPKECIKCGKIYTAINNGPCPYCEKKKEVKSDE